MSKIHILCGFLLFALFVGCSSSGGPKPEPIKMSGEVVPKKEPISRSGNPPSYEVFGKRYTISGTSEGYNERGLASWYGSKFHGKKTSSGVPYNMYAMTAAHKTLPIPTYVRVTRLDNGRSIVVKVNDRGPFVHNRIIDLSYTAASKLAMIKTGTTTVEVTALSPYQYLPGVNPGKSKQTSNTLLASRSTPVTTVPAKASVALIPTPVLTTSVPAPFRPSLSQALTTPTSSWTKPFYLQVGAFSQRNNAERLQTHLASNLTHAIRIDVAANQIFKVRVGPLNDAEQAQRLTTQLAALGIHEARPVFD